MTAMEDEQSQAEVVVEVEVEDVHVADEYVVDVSPESVEDADIELTVRGKTPKRKGTTHRRRSLRIPCPSPDPIVDSL